MTDMEVREGRLSPPLSRDLPVLVAGPLAGLVVWSLWTQVGDVQLQSGSDGAIRTIEAPAVVVAGLLFTLLGWALLRILEARTASGLRVWTWVSLGVMLVSLVGTLGATTTAAGLGLASLHLVVGLVLVGGLHRVR